MSAEQSTFLSLNTIAASLVLLAIVACWVRVYRDDLAFFFGVFWARLPFIGTVRRLQSRAAMRTAHVLAPHITKAETAIAAPFLPQLVKVSRPVFENLATYIKKAEDSSIHPKAPPVLMTLALVLALPEGWSAGYVLLPWISSEISTASRDMWAGVIGYGLAVVFYILAHWAGSLSRRAHYARRYREAWQEDGQVGNCNPPEVTPGDNQRADDGRPAYEQFFARCQTRAWWASASTVILGLLLLFGVLVTSLRYVGLEHDAAREATFQAQMAAQAEVQAEGEQAPPKVVQVVGSSVGTVIGTVVALSVFLLTFIAVQVIGFLAGTKHSFNGSRSEEAFQVLRGCMTYEAYEAQRERLVARLEPVFSTLQAGLSVRGRQGAPSLRQVIAWLDQERTGHEPPAAPSPSPSPAVSPIDITGRVRRVEPGGL